MALRCPACQTLSPDWSEFCLHCGRTFTEKDREQSIEVSDSCIDCGSELTFGSNVCPSCGSASARGMDMATAFKKSMIAKLLALIPGIFNFFGLGHLYLGKYPKAFLLLMASVALRLANERWVVPGEIPNAELIWLGASLVVFIYQLWDVYRITDREMFGR